MQGDSGSRYILQESKEEKDLGVCVDNMLKFSDHVAQAACKANRLLGLIRRSFTHVDITLTRTTFCLTRSLSNATFSFLITWRLSSSKSAAVYKISSKSDDFSLIYGDISIFKMAVVRHLGIILPPYETTHEVSVAGRSCLSNFMSISYTYLKIYSYLNFSHIRLEMPIQAPKMGVLGDFGPPKCDYSSSRPPKGTSLRKSVSFKLSTVKIRWGVWPVGELTESVTDTHTRIWLDRQWNSFIRSWSDLIWSMGM